MYIYELQVRLSTLSNLSRIYVDPSVVWGHISAWSALTLALLSIAVLSFLPSLACRWHLHWTFAWIWILSLLCIPLDFCLSALDLAFCSLWPFFCLSRVWGVSGSEEDPGLLAWVILSHWATCCLERLTFGSARNRAWCGIRVWRLGACRVRLWRARVRCSSAFWVGKWSSWHSFTFAWVGQEIDVCEVWRPVAHMQGVYSRLLGQDCTALWSVPVWTRANLSVWLSCFLCAPRCHG